MLDIIVPVSPRTNGCPEKSGAAQGQLIGKTPMQTFLDSRPMAREKQQIGVVA